MGLFDGFDKPVTKGDLWTAIIGVKAYDAAEKAREKREEDSKKMENWFKNEMHQVGRRNRHDEN